MNMDRETIIKLAREVGIPWFDEPNKLTEVQTIERFAGLVAEHVIKDAPDYKMGYADGVAVEREAVIALLKGIDETEIESQDGWWETSEGAAFGASILAAIRARDNT